MDKIEKIGRPFVRENSPLVWNNNLPIQPFVLRKRPLIGIYGFTLIELMVTLAVAAVLLVVAVPSMRNIIQNSRIITQVNDFISDVQVARTEAIKRAGRIVICPSTNGSTCTAGWSNGRLMFADSAPYDSAPGAGELIVRYHDPLPAGSLQAVTSANFPALLIFNGRGELIDSTGLRLLDYIPTGVPIQAAVCDTAKKVSGRMLSIGGNGQASAQPITLTCP